jgi:hypothetical protein
MQIRFSRLGRWQKTHLSHIIAGLRRLGLDGSSFKGLPKQWVDNNKDLYDYLHLIEQNVKQ